ncbi:helix-turn-helix domain-containing protein [Rhodococcus opacus]|uniref:helix-turn-helix domain-containing protein n=1 Tax=Rhodococcus opacus TaxID=37919 RepID=UPI0010635677|nr:cupin domain-containing protein [Rhodococcus opacus]MBA8958362.1 transcriptional regulator with XRE-family HTH domain [Rhodococcus opacus]MBP2203927.1 transcriptional regulator with XRE-family HTH domain [Rhodococcus opacus]MDJ0419916.1 cupin domain-containing protein [Rhodococcus opacus]UNM97787.1 cupin domain-containing protein [Rhodococcus opacus]
MDEDQRTLAVAIGTAIRSARRDAGLTLRDVAAKTGLSQPFLSQAENGHSVPSVMNLHRVARVLGTTAHALLEQGARTPTSLVRGREGRRFALSDGAVLRFCSTGVRAMEPNEVTAQPGSQAGEHTEHAGEEFIYVIDGSIRVEVGVEESYVLDRGDTLYYPATVPHRWFNDAAEPARFLITSTPPSF